MSKSSLFIVIEGLDGSGKTTASKVLANTLHQAFPNKIRNTFEPHDPSAAGLFIRDVLTKKITNFDHYVLALGYATNRLDHCKRVIEPWLSGKGQIIISDRYYLSSLVYQAREGVSFDDVMELNKKAIRPDLIFFMNVSNEVCYQRMAKRNQPQELFETKLDETRNKYLKAIDYLRGRGDHIVEIDASGSVEEIVQQILGKLHEFAPVWAFDRVQIQSLEENTVDIKQKARAIQYLEKLGYQLGKSLPTMHFETSELIYHLPGGLIQKGGVVFLSNRLTDDVVLKTIKSTDFYTISDFLFVFSTDTNSLENRYYQRDSVSLENGINRISPNVKFLSYGEI